LNAHGSGGATIRSRLLVTLISSLLLSLALAAEPDERWELRVCSTRGNLPFSDEHEAGFENRIASIIAAELHARITYVWLPRAHNSRLDSSLIREGECDVVMGVADGQAPYLTTLSYYASTYVFVVRDDAPFRITSLDDPVLRDLRLATMQGEAPDVALAGRGIVVNIQHHQQTEPFSVIVDAVAGGTADVGLQWGPIAGYFVKSQDLPLTLTPVTPQIAVSFTSMVLPVSIGVRASDVELRDLLNRTLAISWDEIQAVLQEFGVPLLPISRPTLALEGG
jgi:quinoprotein dehydrogenase-associated probable ABC transporter substrate-binding protein